MKKHNQKTEADNPIAKNIEFSLTLTPEKRLKLLDNLRRFSLLLMDKKAHDNNEYLRKVKK